MVNGPLSVGLALRLVTRGLTNNDIHMKLTLLSLAVLILAPSVASAQPGTASLKAKATEGTAAEGEKEDPPTIFGYEVGNFSIKDIRPAEGAKTRLSFTLHAAVLDDELPRFKKLAAARQARIRDQVITSIRLSEPTDYQEANLGHLRRRILLRLRRALPELKIEEMLVSEWHYVVE